MWIVSLAFPGPMQDAIFMLTGRPDFRMLAKATETGKTLTKGDVEHLMALFGTFPPDVESEP